VKNATHYNLTCTIFNSQYIHTAKTAVYKSLEQYNKMNAVKKLHIQLLYRHRLIRPLKKLYQYDFNISREV